MSHLIKNVSGKVQSQPKTLEGIGMSDTNNNWQIGQVDVVSDDVISYYTGHTDVFQILDGVVPASLLASGVTFSSCPNAVNATVINFNNTPVPMTLDGTNAYGGLEILDLPQSNIAILGGTTNLTVATGKQASSGILTGASLVGAVGTVTAPAATTLTTTAANIIPSTAATLTTYAGAMPGKSTSTQLAVIDGDTTALKLFLNFACGTANTTTDSIIVNGQLTIVWASLGLN